MRPVSLVALSLLIGFALGAWLVVWLHGRRGRREGVARNLRGKRGEERAAALLEEAGYRILERQRRSAYRVRVDAAELDVGVSFDFVVLRDGRELIAEVKTGTLVTRLRHAETRRQLLEYQLVSGREAVLLVDPERACITEVSFPLPNTLGTPEASLSLTQPRDWAMWAWVLALAIGATALWYHSG
jgi:hypothetical protein